jgi:hypothetical protein
MADEIQISTTMTVREGNINWTPGATSFTATLTAAAPARASGIASIGTTHEAIPLGDVATLGMARLKNVDATNYIEIGVVVSATFYPVVRINTNESCVFRLAQGITPYARANTAAARLEYDIFDD